MIIVGDFVRIKDADQLADTLKEFGGKVAKVIGMSVDGERIITDVTGMHVLGQDDLILIREEREFTELENKLYADNMMLREQIKQKSQDFIEVSNKINKPVSEIYDLCNDIDYLKKTLQRFNVEFTVNGVTVKVGDKFNVSNRYDEDYD